MSKKASEIKVSEVTLEQFVQFVKNKEPVLCEKAVNDGKLDITQVIKRVKEDVVPNFSVLTGVSKAVAELRAALEMALAKEVPCYYLGEKDRPGLNIPISVVLLRLSGDGAKPGTKATLFEATTFDPKFELPDGTKTHLTEMSKVTLKLKENTKFDSFEIVQLVKHESVPSDKMATLLAGVINDPRKFTEDDKYKPIVLLGNIRSIFPVNILGKDENDDWKVTGEHPLLVPNQLEESPVETPVFKIGLEPIHGITVRVTFDARKYTDPIVDVADLMDAIHTSVRTIKNPKDQAIAVSEDFGGREVLVVGSISKVSSNKAGSTFMEVSAYTIIDAPQKVDWFNGLPGAASDSGSAPAEETPAPAPAPAATPAPAPLQLQQPPLPQRRPLRRRESTRRPRRKPRNSRQPPPNPPRQPLHQMLHRSLSRSLTRLRQQSRSIVVSST